ncbi:phage BR0599 family protein [Proteus mirabilis]|uniref:phage BR0599 family protein n=1 Tax=Proteus mirabilis TaxID=584 RepID=UPI002377848F|nr:phage BR0599 family protein [Proteus mirabilis]MDW8541406.1 phage BR0599 family protein [Proteus mirabilis]UNI72720.1 putative tail assembly protein [Proteus phage Isf-Pm1]UXY92217.1 tail assembly protein [Proteus phage RP6]
MAYNQLEISTDDGQPIYLYEFRLNDNYWRYTSAKKDIQMLGQTWLGTPMEDDGIRQTSDAQSDSLTILMPQSAVIVDLFRGTPPINAVTLKIRRFHRGDTEAAVCYVGEVLQLDTANAAAAKITCNTLSASMEQNGLRLAWSRSCPHALYNSSCGVNPADFMVEATIQSVGSNNIMSKDLAPYGESYFAGGYIEWVDKLRGVERRAIQAHSYDSIEIFGTVGGITGGMIIKVFPGCPRTVASCRDKFNNLANYGGIPSMPGRSPFDGNPVY